MIRKRETQRLGWVYEPSWCCRNIPLSVIGLINVSQSGCSQRRPSHLLLSFTLPAYLSLAIRVLQPMNPRVARADVTPGLLTRSCRREPVSQCDGKVGGAGACWMQIDGPDEIEALRWQRASRRGLMQRSVGSGGNPRHAVDSPGAEGNEVGWWILGVRIIWAHFEGSQKRKRCRHFRQSRARVMGKKPVPTGPVPGLRICVGSVLVADRAEGAMAGTA